MASAANDQFGYDRYRILFERSEDPMWVIRDDHFVVANEAAVSCLGYGSVDEVVQAHPSLFSPLFQSDGESSKRKAGRMMSIAMDQGYHRFEWDHQRKNGEVFPVEVTLTKMPFDKEEALFCIWRDITEHKTTLKQLENAKAIAERADATKSEFLANMSHELRTPLNAIIGFSELILCGVTGPNNSKTDEYVRSITAAGQNLLGLIDQILEASRLEAVVNDSQLAQSDVYGTLRDCVELISDEANQRGVTITLRCQSYLPTVNVNPKHLSQILFNLLSNAVKYNKPEGTIDCEVEVVSKEKLQITISDTGTGIASEDIDRVFAAFERGVGAYQAKEVGAGLGLTLAKKLTEMNCGEMTIESAKNVGTKISVSFSTN